MTGSPQTKAKTPAIPAQIEIRFKLNPTKTHPKTAPRTVPFVLREMRHDMFYEARDGHLTQ